MRFSDIDIDAPVFVTRGYSRRPAIVVRKHEGKIAVRFTDVPPGLKIAPGHAQYLYGATVRPNAVDPR